MRWTGRTIRWASGAIGLAVTGYAAYVGVAWYRYGHARGPAGDETDALLDDFMPEYEVAERHHVGVSAPAEITLSAAEETDLQRSAVIRAIFYTRASVLGADTDQVSRPRGLLAQMTSLGWGVLAEKPGREVVVGAVTQPWMPNVVFRALPPDHFKAFCEPGYVKIVWTLRADPVSPRESIFRTETRVTTTDLTARARFRWYWARFSAGIVLIRRAALTLMKADAEGRARQARPALSGS